MSMCHDIWSLTGANSSPQSIEFVDGVWNIDILVSEVQATVLPRDTCLKNYSDRYYKRLAKKEVFISLYPNFQKLSS